METYKEFIAKKKLEVKKGKKFNTKDIGRNGYRVWKTEAMTLMKQTDHDEKVFIIERNVLEHVVGKTVTDIKPGYKQYRIGYFIIGKNGKRNGIWTWGQYCPNIPLNDFSKLINLAKKEKTIIY